MKAIQLIAIVLFALIYYSCEDDNEIKTIEIKTTEIKIGDYSKMIINYYDTTLIGGYNQSKYFNLDLDNDGNNDIQFESVLWGSPAVGQHPKSVIKSLSDNVQIYGFHSNDTAFLNRDTSIFMGANNIIEVYYRFNNTCHQIDINDSILKINPTFKLIPLNRGDTTKISDVYDSDKIILINDWYNLPRISYEINKDTTVYEINTFFNDCTNFPLDEIKYVGVRFKNESRLGWIKMSVFDKYKILILESGVQE